MLTTAPPARRMIWTWNGSLVESQASCHGSLTKHCTGKAARTIAATPNVARQPKGCLRNVATEAIAPVGWRVGSFALVETVRGEGAYRTLAEWPLAGGKT